MRRFPIRGSPLPSAVAAVLTAVLGSACSPDVPFSPQQVPDAAAVAPVTALANSARPDIEAVRVALDDVLDRVLPGLALHGSRTALRAAIEALADGLAENPAAAGPALARATRVLEAAARDAPDGAYDAELDVIRLVLEMIAVIVPDAQSPHARTR